MCTFESTSSTPGVPWDVWMESSSRIPKPPLSRNCESYLSHVTVDSLHNEEVDGS